MESQETLVNPAPPMRYYFSSSDVRNTQIFSAGSLAYPIYTTVTDAKTDKRTEMKNAQGDVVAVWTRRDILSDTISWPRRDGGKSTTTNRWLKKADGADGTVAYSLITPVGPVLFRSSAKHRIGVYLLSPLASASSIDETDSIAYLDSVTEGHAPSLVISAQAEAEAIRDEIVLAILVLGHKFRITDTPLGAAESSSSRTGLWRDIVGQRNQNAYLAVPSNYVDCFVL